MQKTPRIYDQRNDKKFGIKEKVEQNIRVGEFRWYREGMNIGNEISKDGGFKRVCFVIQNHVGNGLILVAPITTKYHKWMSKYYIEVKGYEKYGLKKCWIILNQIKFIDKKRFSHITGTYRPHTGFSNVVFNTFFSTIKK